MKKVDGKVKLQNYFLYILYRACHLNQYFRV